MKRRKKLLGVLSMVFVLGSSLVSSLAIAEEEVVLKI